MIQRAWSDIKISDIDHPSAVLKKVSKIIPNVQQIIQLYSYLGSKSGNPDIIPFEGWNAWDGREGQLCSQHSWWHTCFISLPKCVHCPGVSSWIIICQSANIRYITSSWPLSTKSICFVSFQPFKGFVVSTDATLRILANRKWHVGPPPWQWTIVTFTGPPASSSNTGTNPRCSAKPPDVAQPIPASPHGFWGYRRGFLRSYQSSQVYKMGHPS